MTLLDKRIVRLDLVGRLRRLKERRAAGDPVIGDRELLAIALGTARVLQAEGVKPVAIPGLDFEV